MAMFISHLRLVKSNTVQVSCQVRRRDVTVTAEDEYCQSEFNTLRGTQLMHFLEQWSN